MFLISAVLLYLSELFMLLLGLTCYLFSVDNLITALLVIVGVVNLVFARMLYNKANITLLT